MPTSTGRRASRVRRWRARALLGLAIVWATAGVAAAHSFDIAVIAPFSGPEVAQGQALWQGMRVATREADGHPAETSDGHLGGVDSNLLKVDSAAPVDILRARLERLFGRDGVAIAVVAPAARASWVAAGAAPPGVVIAPGDPPLAGAWRGAPVDAADFAARYRADYGQAPSAAARGGYAGARLIDRAMRVLDGDLSDRARVIAAFERAGR